MTYKLDSEKEPKSDYATNWGKRAITRIREYTLKGEKVLIINPDAFSSLADTLEKRGPSRQREFAASLREFEGRLKSLVHCLDQPDLTLDDQIQEVRIEVSSLFKLLDECTAISTQWKKEEAFRAVKRAA